MSSNKKGKKAGRAAPQADEPVVSTTQSEATTDTQTVSELVKAEPRRDGVENGDPNAQENSTELVEAKIAEIEEDNRRREEEEREVAARMKSKAKAIKAMVDAAATPEERLQVMQTQYNELLAQNKQLEKQVKSTEKKLDTAVRERDRGRTELDRLTQAKLSLESLCRELQKRKDTAVEEGKRLAKEADQRHLEMTEKFRTALNDISAKMEVDSEERINQLKDAETSKARLLNYVEQYELREKHFATQLKAKDLETQLAEAKLAQQVEIANAESTRRQRAELDLSTAILLERETKAQLNVYKEKFGEFEAMMNKSNEMLLTFKTEMDNSLKRATKLDAENKKMKQKQAEAQLMLVQIAEAEKAAKDESKLAVAQKEKLESLCRILRNQVQQSRTQLKQYDEATKTLAMRVGQTLTQDEIRMLELSTQVTDVAPETTTEVVPA